MALQFEVLSVKTWEMPKLTQQMITSDFEVFLPEPEIWQNFAKITGLQKQVTFWKCHRYYNIVLVSFWWVSQSLTAATQGVKILIIIHA